MTTQSGFEEGIRFAVKALRERAVQYSNADMPHLDLKVRAQALRDMASELEAHVSGADAPKVLVLPLRWHQASASDWELSVGPLRIGTVFKGLRGHFEARGWVTGFRKGGYGTIEAAKAELEQAVMELGEQS
jgi:hypothetical protein